MTDPRPPLFDQLLVRRRHIPVTLLLIAANLLVFAAMLTQGAGLWHTDNGVQLAWGANFGPATKDGEWWRLASALFLHFGVLHLGMNMLSLWDGGRLVERMYGPARFLLLYVASGLTGNLLSLIAQGDRAISGGASGAIFGVYGGLMVYLWRERANLHPAEFKRLFWGAAVFSALTIFLGFQVTGIDNAAHIGGFATGILSGLALGHPRHAPRPALPRLAAGGLLAALVLVLLARIPEPRYRWSEEVRARGEIGAFLREDARITARWGSLLGRAGRGEASFDELAGRIENEVAAEYADSFEQLSRLRLDPAAPSAPALNTVRQYAELRLDASRALVEGLRAHDPRRVREALELANQAPWRAVSERPPPEQQPRPLPP